MLSWEPARTQQAHPPTQADLLPYSVSQANPTEEVFQLRSLDKRGPNEGCSRRFLQRMAARLGASL